MHDPALSPSGFANATLARVVQLVRAGEATTRLDLSQHTGLGRAIIRQRVDLAIELGLLEESGVGESTGGRVPRLLRFRSETGYLALAALGAASAEVGIADLSGNLLTSRRFAWDISLGPIPSMASVVDQVRSQLNGLPPASLWGVGVGLPGPVEFSTGKPVAPPIMPGWNGIDVRGHLEDELDAPAWVDNDVNILALGELGRRAGAQAANLLYVKVGSGIGAGLVSNGGIHRGADGAAGDFGHVAIPGSTTLCRCGQTGCLEASAGGWALVRDATEAAHSGASTHLRAALETRGALTLQDVFDAVNVGDPFANRAVNTAARTIGEALASIVSVFNPSLIVLGGGDVALGESYLARVRESIYRRSLPLATRNLQIVPPHPDGEDSLRGTATLVGDQLFGQGLGDWVAEGTPVASILAQHKQDRSD